MSVELIKYLLNDGYDAEDIGCVIHNGKWISDGKWEHLTDVIEITAENMIALECFDNLECKPGHYEIVFSRSGSYYTDYEYDEPTVTEVEIYYETVRKLKWKNKQ